MSDVKVTMHETPAEIPAMPTDGVEIVDSLGRKLKIKDPAILQESRLVRALGGDASMNSGYMMGYVMPAAMVVEIDGIPVNFPVTEAQLEASIQRIGREGLAAVMNHFTEKAQAAADRAAAIKK